MLRCNKIFSSNNFQLKVLLILVFFSFSKIWGQAILTFDFAGATGSEVSLPSSTNDPNISSSTITRSGLTASANGDRFGSTNFSISGTIDLTKYIEFTVTPNAGFQISVTSVVFLYQRSGTGPRTFALRSSFDGYVGNLGGALAGVDVTSTQTFNFGFSAISPTCDTPITFRLYVYNSEATAGTGGPEDGGNTTNKDIVVNGSVSSCGGCVPPSITSQPTSVSTTSAGTASYTVVASGTAPAYQWQENTGSGFSNITNGGTNPTYAGANSAVLTISNPPLSMSGYSYQCVVTNTCPGTATSNTATLSIITCVTPSISPSSQSVCISNAAVISTTISGTATSYQWQMSSNNSTWLSVAAGTPAGVSYSGGTTGTISVTGTSAVSNYYYRCLIATSAGCTFTTAAINLTVFGISTNPYTSYVTPAQTSTFVVIATGTPISYQWQVNAGSGYSAISSGGVYSGATTSLLTVSNPPTSMNSYSYQCVVSYSCGSQTSTTGILNVNDVTSANCPKMTGVLVNSCTGSCQEGDNEILFFNSGTSSIPVTPANIVVTYGNTVNPAATYTDSFTSNATQTANLNSLASSSCTTLFVDATAAGIIPANSVFMIARNSNCFDYDLSTFCSLGTIYVLYSTDASWTVGGNFSNGGNVGELRFFTANFNAVSGGCTTSYNYQPNLLVGGDGAGIAFTVGGGAANSYFNNGCNPPLTILPIELIDFYATKNNDVNDVFWKVGSEENVLHYTIDKSNNGIDFKELTTVFVSSNSQTKTYNLVDQEPFSDITYYRLGTKEKNGKDYFHKIISVNEKSDDWKCNHYQQEQNLVIEFKNSVPKHSTISLFDLSGKLLAEEEVKNSQTKINVQNFAEGIYFVRITTPYKTENFKIIIQK